MSRINIMSQEYNFKLLERPTKKELRSNVLAIEDKIGKLSTKLNIRMDDMKSH